MQHEQDLNRKQKFQNINIRNLNLEFQNAIEKCNTKKEKKIIEQQYLRFLKLITKKSIEQ